MKNISTSLLADIQNGVTTLCRCVEIVRRDGKSFHFTDHDVALLVENHTYSPTNSFAATSITQVIDTEIDAVTIVGILNGDGVEREDVRAGLFDFAEIRYFLVNYAAPEKGAVTLRVGWLGEVVLNEDQTFSAEIRSIGQALAMRIGRVYSPLCRADLGDRRCKFPLRPRFWSPNTHYSTGDTVLVRRGVATNYNPIPIANPSWEADGQVASIEHPLAWTSYGSPGSTWSIHTSVGDMTAPADGLYFIVQSETVNGTTERGMFQDLNIINSVISAEAIDTGLCRVYTSLWFGSLDKDATQRLRLLPLDANGKVTGLIHDSGMRTVPTNAWRRYEAKDILIPAGTRWIRFDIFSTKGRNAFRGSAFDRLEAVINLPDGTYANEAHTGAIAYKALSSGMSGTIEPGSSGSVVGPVTSGTPDFLAYGLSYPDLVAEWQRISSYPNSQYNSFATQEAFYEWHWYNHGLQEGRTLPYMTGYQDGDLKWQQVTRTFLTIGTVVSVTDNQTFVSNDILKESGYYDGGLLYWETGRNAGRFTEIRDQNSGRITTFVRMVFTPQVGDRFVIYPGCDKTLSTCKDKFDNVLNFRGEPHVPGQDKFLSFPNADGSYNQNITGFNGYTNFNLPMSGTLI